MSSRSAVEWFCDCVNRLPEQEQLVTFTRQGKATTAKCGPFVLISDTKNFVEFWKPSLVVRVQGDIPKS